VADPTRTVWYAPRQRYARAALGDAADAGDRSRWLAFEASTVEAAARAVDRSPRRIDALASRRDGCPPEALLLHDRLFRQLERPGPADGLAPLEVDELALRLLTVALRGESEVSTPHRPSPADRGLARRVEELLALRFGERWTLAGLAGEAGSSPFHLARAFRRVTGRSIHRHLVRLRLRQALDRLDEARRDLAGLALDLGFSSHSHFSALFRRTYGVSPSEVVEGRIRTVRADLQPTAIRTPRPSRSAASNSSTSWRTNGTNSSS
jgi:AraC-like DNA-binding protein